MDTQTLSQVTIADEDGGTFTQVLTAAELAEARADVEWDLPIVRVRPAVFGPFVSEIEREIPCDCGRGSYSSQAPRDHCLECELEPFGYAWQAEQRERY
jgi:hypothetical protein